QGEAELDVAAAALGRTAFDVAHLVDGSVVLDHVSLLDVVGFHAGPVVPVAGVAVDDRPRMAWQAADFRRSARHAPHPGRRPRAVAGEGWSGAWRGSSGHPAARHRHFAPFLR